MSNSLVQSKSIESTLNALEKDTERFRKEAANTDAERRRVEEYLSKTLHSKQISLSNELRSLQDELGRFHRERSMLIKEEERLREQLRKERVALEECCNATDKLTVRQREAKRQFANDMSRSNKELMDLLNRQDDFRVQNLLTVETVSSLIDWMQPRKIATEEVKRASEQLRTSSEKLQETLDLRRSLQKKIDNFRLQVSKPTTAEGKAEISKDDIHRLEQTWLRGENGNMNEAVNGDAHLLLFYGSQPDQQHADSNLDGEQQSEYMDIDTIS